jgi:hypothetical protein
MKAMKAHNGTSCEQRESDWEYNLNLLGDIKGERDQLLGDFVLFMQRVAMALGPSGDVRALPTTQQLVADIDQQRLRVSELENALTRARDDMEGWGGYASDYFQNKWGFADDLAAIDKVLGREKASPKAG